MKVIPFIYQDDDDLVANTFLIVDENNNCIVIDPSKEYDGIKNFIIKNSYSLKAIILTHAHIDHMRGVNLLNEEFNAPLYMGEYEIPYLNDPFCNCSIFLNEEIDIKPSPFPLKDKEEINLLSSPLEVIWTPYHTYGSICLYLPKENILFSGDSLFASSIGRSDFKNSKPKMMDDSLRKIMKLPDECKIYPGHGSFTNIKQERMTNYFVKYL